MQATRTGNHRLYGCILFSPLLGNSNMLLKHTSVYTPKNGYLEKIKETLELINKLQLKSFYVEIDIIKYNKLTIDIKKNDICLFSISRLETKQIESFLDENLLLKCLNSIHKNQKANICDEQGKINFHFYEDGKKNSTYNSFQELEKAIFKNNTSLWLRIKNYVDSILAVYILKC